MGNLEFIPICIVDIPAWGQLFVGLAALIVSIVALLSNKQIRELIKLTKEQKRQSDALIAQNEILNNSHSLESQRLSLERQLSQTSRMPFFVKINELDQPQLVQIFLKNVGIEASNLKIENLSPGDYWSPTVDGNRVPNEQTIRVYIKSASGEYENIYFDLTYQGHDGVRRSQKIHKVLGGQFDLDLPIQD